jgi:DNA-binding MarR family transcriptional regulator
MTEASNTSTDIYHAVLNSEEPIKALMDLTAAYLERGDMGSLYDVDLMLIDRFIDCVRNSPAEDLDAFIYPLLAFLDSDTGDRLKTFDKGERLFHRWEHLYDLSSHAMESYDPRHIPRFVASRKHGKQLLEALHGAKDGMRVRDLAKELGISQQYLAKLLREFEKEDLVLRERGKGGTFARLGFAGRVYMAEILDSELEAATGDNDCKERGSQKKESVKLLDKQECEPVEKLEEDVLSPQQKERIEGMRASVEPSGGRASIFFLPPGRKEREAA